MRMESSVTSLSWIPSEAVTGANKPMFELGIAHYDNPPPDVLDGVGRRGGGAVVGLAAGQRCVLVARPGTQERRHDAHGRRR